MAPPVRVSARALLTALLLAAAGLVPVAGARAAGGGAGLRAGGGARTGSATGGAALGGLAPKPKAKPRRSHSHAFAHGRWLGGVTITEYWPAPEAWFVGRAVATPGLPSRHRIDWLYSATGVSMEGEGIGLDGRMYHIDALGDGGWVTANGLPTSPADGWSGGSPFWRAGGYWANRSAAVTFPLLGGGWWMGHGRRYVPLPRVTFAPGSSLPLHFYQSIAVDPSVIPLGSSVYLPAYAHDGHGGWFRAQDTGGAINGRHIDVYRSPPASPSDSGAYLTDRRIFVAATPG